MAIAPGIGDHVTLASLYLDGGFPVQKGSKDESVRIQTIRRLLGHDTEQPRVLIHRNCVNLIRELRNWQYDKNGKPADKDNHLIDCLGYVVMYFASEAGTGGSEWSVVDEPTAATTLVEPQRMGILTGGVEKVVTPDGGFTMRHVLKRLDADAEDPEQQNPLDYM